MNSVMESQNEQVGALMKDFIDTVLGFYENIRDQEICAQADEQTLARLQKQGVPQIGRPVDEVYHEMLHDVYRNNSLVQHPRCFACIPTPVSLLSWMGDIMTNAFDPHAGCRMNASAASAVEQELIRWMCGLAGYKEGSGGLFVSGGSMANLTALTAARDAKLTETDRAAAVAYVSDQTHSSVAKGLHIIGFRADQVRKIPADASFRMDMDALRTAIDEDIANGKKPFAVIATAGTTNTGSIDPLTEIAAVCRAHNMWMHVDGAFGASVLLSGRYRKRLAGIELSDSLSWDAHKWLMQTYGCSVVLVRDQSRLIRSFAVHPEYLKDAGTSGADPDYWDLGPELTRPARSLKLWITLQVMGREEIGRMIEHGYEMAELAEQTIRKYPGWEIISPAQQGIVNFRYAPAGIPSHRLDGINRQIAKEITDSGYAQILTTELNGKKVLRICALNPQTTKEDIRGAVERLVHSKAAGRYRTEEVSETGRIGVGIA